MAVSAEMKEMVDFYIEGPQTLKGWYDAGLKVYSRRDKVPKPSKEGMRALVVKAGGRMPSGTQSVDLTGFSLPAPDDPNALYKIKEMVDKVMPIYRNIMMGLEDPTASQRMLLKSFIEMYLKTVQRVQQQRKETVAEAGVVVLPTLGPPTHACPVCSYDAGMTLAEVKELIEHRDLMNVEDPLER